MKLFSNRSNGGYHIIIGCGRLGADLAHILCEHDDNVLVIDQNPAAFRKLSSGYTGQVLEGDATDLHVLAEAGIDQATVVMAVTNDDNANILVAQVAKEVHRVPRVIARLYDPDRECVYHELGIDSICPALLSAREVDRFLHAQTEVSK